MDSSSSIVIKVKYGETLRRFLASIEDKKIGLDIVTLREKIRSLFSFGSNNIDYFTLTYVDEDGDEVTLVDDYDLQDVVEQSLNPLRITVKLNNGKKPVGITNTTLQPHSHQFQNLKATSEDPKLAGIVKAAVLNSQTTRSMGCISFDESNECYLASDFVVDVNVPDGTIMAPFTTFTKVWKMCNNGPVIWPQGLRLHWVRGDRLGSSLFVDVKIPVDGLSMDEDLDIEVDFMAPEVPGRYISYWRMVSPSGHKFGKHVWVDIQVDDSRKDLGLTSLNLTLPPIMNNPDKVVDQNQLMDSGNNDSEPEAASADSDPIDHETDFPNDLVISDNDDTTSTDEVAAAMSLISDSTDPVETASTSLPVGPMGEAASSDSFSSDSTQVESSGSSTSLPVGPMGSSGSSTSLLSSALVRGLPPPAPPSRVASTSQIMWEPRNDDVQELLQYLEMIGFKKLDLNMKILEMNNNDLEKTIDDLCCALEWEPMLENLQQMGFLDEETNRRLMEKNYGSITQTITDLINQQEAY